MIFVLAGIVFFSLPLLLYIISVMVVDIVFPDMDFLTTGVGNT